MKHEGKEAFGTAKQHFKHRLMSLPVNELFGSDREQ